MSFKANLKKIRKEKNWRQKELAFKMGLTSQTISFWESGRHEPTAIQRKKLCRIFKITENKLFEEENKLPILEGQEVIIRIGQIILRGKLEYAN